MRMIFEFQLKEKHNHLINMINENNKKITDKINSNFEAKCLGANESNKKFKSPPEMLD